MNIRLLAIAAALLVFFAGWTALTWRPVFVTYHSKYSIFFRHYQQHGLLRSRFIPTFNFEMTDPPTTRYVSSPLVPVIMYAAASLLGDRPPTYYGVIIALHVVAFALLAYFVRRRWGDHAAVWALTLAVFSKYALTFGDFQSPAALGVIGSFATVFLYFEWIETRERRAIVLCTAAYVVGLAANWFVALTAGVLCVHWVVVVRDRHRRDWFALSVLPATTVLFAVVMITLMWQAEVPLSRLLRRAAVRSAVKAESGALRAFVAYPLDLLGPVMLVAALGFVAWLVFLRGRGDVRHGRTLEVLGCLAAAGLLPLLLFAQAYQHHRYFVVHLLPFCAVSGALGIRELSGRWRSPGIRRVFLAGLAGLAIMSAVVGNDRLRLARAAAVSAEPRSRFERIQRLAAQVKPGLRDGDRLLILSRGRSSSLEKVTAFYELWIPSTAEGRSERWDALVSSGRYRLILTIDARGFEWMRASPDARPLVADGTIAFFELGMLRGAAADPR